MPRGWAAGTESVADGFTAWPRSGSCAKDGCSGKATGSTRTQGSLTTILRQSLRKLAENANASGRKIGPEKFDAARKMGYFLRFVRMVRFERRLLRM
jgi:hypothetical protein